MEPILLYTLFLLSSSSSSSSSGSSSGRTGVNPHDLSNFGYRTVSIAEPDSCLVFQKDPGGAVIPGFQYWNGDSIFVNLSYREQNYTIAYEDGTYGYVDASYIDLSRDTSSYAGSGGSSQTYNTYGDYIFPASSVRKLTESDVKGAPYQVLCYGRNEIYARHGRLFASSELSDWFYSQDWYDPYIDGDDFDESVFNSYEKYNAYFLKSYENGRYSLDEPGYDFNAVYQFMSEH